MISKLTSQLTGATSLMVFAGWLGWSGQDSPAVSPRACTIQTEQATAAGSLDDRVSLGFMDWQYTSARADGGLAIAPMAHPGTLALFDAGGAHRTSIERHGEGPGEFSAVRDIARGEGDSFYIAHPRGVLVVREDGTVVNETRTEFVPTGVAVSRDGSVLVSTAGEPRFHEFDAQLDPGPTFGLPFDGDPSPHLVLMAPATGGGWWTAARNRYILTHHRDGETLRTVTPDEGGFSPWTRQPEGAPFRARPEPTLAGIQEDEAGHLWVVLTVPSDSWEPVAEVPQIGDLGALGNQVHSRVDLLDGRTGARLATKRLDHPIGGFIGPRLLVSRELSDAGIVRIRAWSLTLEGC